MSACNLLELLSKAADNSVAGNPDITVYNGKNELVTVLSYNTLLEDSKTRSKKILTGLIIDLRKNPVVILYLDSPHLMISWFWAVLASGAVPCLLAPLTEDMQQRTLQVHALQNLLGKPWIITTSNLLNHFGNIDGLQVRTTDTINAIHEYDSTEPTFPGFSKQSDDLAVLMMTSGSTGSPKAVPLTHGQILAALNGKTIIHNTTRNDVFLNFVDFHHVANLTEIHLHALYLGAQQLHVDKGAFLDHPSLFVEKIQRHRITYTFSPNFFLYRLVTAFQSLRDDWRFMMETTPAVLQQIRPWQGESGAYCVDSLQHFCNTPRFQLSPSNLQLFDLSCLRALVSGGESNVTSICDALESFLCDYDAPRGVIKPGFGMTETCAGAVYNVKDCPRYDLERKSELANLGVCMPGIEMRIMRHGAEARDGEIGSLQLAGPVVFRGYYNNPEQSVASFTPDGWFKTGDLAFLDDNGRLHIAGRENDKIVSNGITHHPQLIEAAIEEAVSDVTPKYTVLFPHRPPGSETEALCVVYMPFNNSSKSYESIDTIATISKAVVKFSGIRPCTIIALPKSLLLKSSLGKLSRSKIRAAYENGDYDSYIHTIKHTHQTYAPPLIETEAFILVVFNELFNDMAQYAGVNTNLFLLGVSSIDLLKLRMNLQKNLGFQFPIATVFSNSVIRDLATEVHSISTSSERLMKVYDPIVVLQPSGAGTPLFFFHPGVGEVLIFMNLARYITDRPVYALRARGFEESEEYFGSMNEIVDTYHDAIRKVQPTGPYCLCGYSFGSIVSFEVAKLIEYSGDEVNSWVPSINHLI